jgi:hypothetical protein
MIELNLVDLANHLWMLRVVGLRMSRVGLTRFSPYVGGLSFDADELADERSDPASALPGAARAMPPRAASPNVASAAALAMRFLIMSVPASG